MTSVPRLSVIIPHLNDEEGLARCLSALDRERADMPDLEVIVVDNGSRTLPEALVAAHDAQLLQEATPGPGPARSTGAKAATAPILSFIDSDCLAEPGWVSGILAHFSRPDAEPIMGGDVGIDLRKPEQPDMLEAYESVYNYRQKLYITRHNFSGTGNLAMRAEIFEKVGDFAGLEIAEDRDWGHRATAMGLSIAYVPNVKITTRAREDFSGLWRKIDRLVGHDFAILKPGLGAKVRWGLKALALIASPAGEIFRVFTSPRLNGLKARWLGFVGMTRVRFYRGVRMLRLLVNPDHNAMTSGWNRI